MHVGQAFDDRAVKTIIRARPLTRHWTPPTVAQSRPMTLKQLEAFYLAATLGSFSLAAQRAHVTQSSLSKRIAELEAYLGTGLFDRSSTQGPPFRLARTCDCRLATHCRHMTCTIHIAAYLSQSCQSCCGQEVWTSTAAVARRGPQFVPATTLRQQSQWELEANCERSTTDRTLSVQERDSARCLPCSHRFLDVHGVPKCWALILAACRTYPALCYTDND